MTGRTLGLVVATALIASAARAGGSDAGPALANDYGPETLDVSKYPAEMQVGYKLMMSRCGQCHKGHRAFNAQYAQPVGDVEAQNKEIEALKASNAELFADKRVLHIEADVWRRFIKRMMVKPGFKKKGEEEGPGAEALKKELGQIYNFLAYDSFNRKIKDSKSWIEARNKMLAEFKAKHPEEYKTNYAQK